MKWLYVLLLIYMSVNFGCFKETSSYPVPAWPDENSTILFEIKDTSKNDFIDQVDKCDSLTEDEKKDVKKWLFGHTHFRMAKWKLGKKVIISVDQYIPRPAYNSKTGQSCTLRSGFMWVRIKEGERVTGYDYEYD